MHDRRPSTCKSGHPYTPGSFYLQRREHHKGRKNREETERVCVSFANHARAESITNAIGLRALSISACTIFFANAHCQHYRKS